MRRFIHWLLVVATLLLAGGHPAFAQNAPLFRQSITSSQVVSTQATVGPVPATGRRHVADCVMFSAAATTAPVLTMLQIKLIDGISGGGSILASWYVTIPAATGQSVAPFAQCGLNLPGTVSTAMTLEFSSLLLNLQENVTLTYFDVLPAPFN